MNRAQMLAALSDRSALWDVLVVGGGATGLGAALDAVSRGHRTALVEAHDFAKGTSSRSTKLIHGGVRYLRQGQIGMVRESLRERGRLLHNAPQIVHQRSFVIPSFRRGERWYYYAGMKAYDWLAGQQPFDASQLLSARQTQELLPTLKSSGLHGGVLYSDGQFDDARLAIALAQSIAQRGGILANYAPAIDLRRASNGHAQLTIRDAESGDELQLSGRVVVNATGVFSDGLMRLDHSLSDPGNSAEVPHIVPSRGSHLVLDREFLPGHAAMLIPKTDDGRVLFAIPWQQTTLIGTTDLAESKIEIDPRPTQAEIEYLLEHAARYLTRAPSQSEIRSMFCGLRPLVRKTHSTARSAALSREHELRVSESGLISVIGGKWTTYRKMGEDVIDLAERVAGLKHVPSATADLVLQSESRPLEAAARSQAAVTVAREQRDLQEAGKLISAADIEWSVAHEMARTVEDMLARRTRWLFRDARAAVAFAGETACVMARQLNRDATWQDQQIASFSRLASGYLP